MTSSFRKTLLALVLLQGILLGVSAQPVNTTTQLPPAAPSLGTPLPPSPAQQSEAIRAAERMGISPADALRQLQGNTPQTPPQSAGNNTASPQEQPTKEGQPTTADKAAEKTNQPEKKDPKAATQEDTPEDIAKKELLRKQQQYDALHRIYGHNTFRDSALKARYTQTAPNAQLMASSEYLVGPGDIFVVTAWNGVELSESLEIASDGSINRQFLGKIYLAGRTYAEAKDILMQRYKAIMPPSAQVEISLGQQQRNISISIVGEAYSPGKYQISAATTVFNALFLSFGVTNIGSVRNIQIKRAGKTVQVFDLYAYLIDGQTDPIYLKNDDVIFIPVQGRIVSIQGNVRRPMRYELRDDESFKDLVRFAGGLPYDAKTSEARLTRLDPAIQREVLLNFDVSQALGNGYPLRDGDEVTIGSLNRGISNIVTVRGGTPYPGIFELRQNEKVSDVITRAGGLNPDTYLDRAYVIRATKPGENRYLPISLRGIYTDNRQLVNPRDTNNVVLQMGDELVLYSDLNFKKKRDIRVSGAIKRSMRVSSLPNMTLKDVLYLVGGPTDNADLENVVLSRVRTPEDINIPADEADTVSAPGGEDPEVASMRASGDSTGADSLARAKRLVRRIGITKNWRDDPTLDTIFVYPYSSIYIGTIDDYITRARIKVGGAVNRPGTFQVYKGMKLRDALYLVGGFKEDLDNQTVELLRRVTDVRQLHSDSLKTNTPYISRILLNRDWRTNPLTDSIDVTGIAQITVRSTRDFIFREKLSVAGAVQSPGTFDLLSGMTLKDVLYRVNGLKENYDNIVVDLYRRISDPREGGPDGLNSINKEIRRITIGKNWLTDPLVDTLNVTSLSSIYVHSAKDFLFEEEVTIDGAVKNPTTRRIVRGMTLRDALYAVGGFSMNLDGQIVDLYRRIDPRNAGLSGLGSDEKFITRIKLDRNWATDPLSAAFDITQFNHITVRSPLEFVRQGYVEIKGLVGRPGKYTVKPNMTLKDLIYQAGGIDLEASFDKIELSRIIEKVSTDGTVVPVPQTITLVRTTQQWQDDPALDDITLNAYDQVYVRPNPDFKKPESVFIKGEVMIPGEYPKAAYNERIASLIRRSGGFSELAYVQGATLTRPGVGQMTIFLKKAVRRPWSRYNLALQDGDVLSIPKRSDVVYINGNVGKSGTIMMFDRGHRRANYYISLAGGFKKKSARGEVSVSFVNGKMRKTHNFIFFKVYPKVEPGSIVNVPTKSNRPDSPDSPDRVRTKKVKIKTDKPDDPATPEDESVAEVEVPETETPRDKLSFADLIRSTQQAISSTTQAVSSIVSLLVMAKVAGSL